MAEIFLRRLIHYALAGGVWLSAALLIAGLTLGQEPWLKAGLFTLLCTPVLRVLILAGNYLQRRQWGFFLVSACVLAMMAFGARLGSH